MNGNEDKQRSVRVSKRKENFAKQFKIKAMAYNRTYAETQQRIS